MPGYTISAERYTGRVLCLDRFNVTDPSTVVHKVRMQSGVLQTIRYERIQIYI